MVPSSSQTLWWHTALGLQTSMGRQLRSPPDNQISAKQQQQQRSDLQRIGDCFLESVYESSIYVQKEGGGGEARREIDVPEPGLDLEGRAVDSQGTIFGPCSTKRKTGPGISTAHQQLPPSQTKYGNSNPADARARALPESTSSEMKAVQACLHLSPFDTNFLGEVKFDMQSPPSQDGDPSVYQEHS